MIKSFFVDCGWSTTKHRKHLTTPCTRRSTKTRPPRRRHELIRHPQLG